MNRNTLLQGIAMAVGLAAAASAQITISSNITTSTTWTSTNVYALSGDIYVEPGATLTIQAGTVIASVNNSTLAVCRGAQIIADGTADAPIIFTSDNDRATWTGGNPKTGTYRTTNNEWGNVTIMGSAYISENQIGTNTPAPSASNYADMEGLSPANTSLNDYGGGDDNDDSGSFSYVSLRYGGRTAAPGVELNGLSLGGIGRNTEIHHIEILNNLDDGIEVWGGTVNLKYLSIWNIGDDSLDLDQGYRGKAQFGLIVQGYSGTGTQGAGFGDNALEIDGAELCNYQPTTTTTLYNFTVIGAPHPTNGGTAGDNFVELADNANVQLRNCIFMDAGDLVLNNRGTDGENGNTGYGCNGTTTYAARWTTAYTVTSTVNPFANPAAAYTAQQSGNLIDFRDNVFFSNLRPLAYTQANTQLVFAGGGGTTNANNLIATLSPITSITRGASLVPNGINTVSPVTFLDPTPANDALTAVEFAPVDGFYNQARFRGAFARGNNWLIGWTATSAFGLTSSSQLHTPIYPDVQGDTSIGEPVHYTVGTLAGATAVTFHCTNVPDADPFGAPGLKAGVALVDINVLNLPIWGGQLLVDPATAFQFGAFALGDISATAFVPPGLPSGFPVYTQWVVLDGAGPFGFSLSNGQRHLLP